ncbi:MAG: HAMP domain-containing sensor histidine kinase [Bacteroidota bacterium]
MKTPKRIQLLWGVALIWTIGMAIGQLSILPNIRAQVSLGLTAGLEDISQQIGQGLSTAYEQAIKSDLLLFSNNSGHLSADSLLAMEWQKQIDLAKMAGGLAIALPDSASQSWIVHEFFPQSRINSPYWLRNTSFCQKIQHSLPLTYDHWVPNVDSFWEGTIDSTLLLYQQDNPFTPFNRFACEPVFDAADGVLIGFVCIQVLPKTIQSNILQPYFDQFFSDKTERRADGIQREFINIRIREGNEGILYQSSLLAGGSFAVRLPISHVSPYLGLLQIETGFLGKTAEQIAASLHRKNIYLVIGIFAVLLVLMGMILITFVKSQRLNRLKSDFLANISHELKTPLSAIKLANDTIRLERFHSKEQMHRSAEIIQEEGDKLERILSRLLDFSRMDAGKLAFQFHPINLQEWAQTHLSLIQEKAKLHGFQVEIVGEVPAASILADSDAIKDVLDILIDNAVKYSADSKRIVLHSSVSDASWQLIIEDFGIGIPGKDHDLVFEKFVRLASVDRHDIPGHGLGLSIARSIMKEHNGRIFLRSTAGKGSQFYLIFPLITT